MLLSISLKYDSIYNSGILSSYQSHCDEVFDNHLDLIKVFNKTK